MLRCHAHVIGASLHGVSRPAKNASAQAISKGTSD
jgi:hypothetical protein